MKKNLTYLMGALLVATAMFASCKKKGPDTSRYSEVCAKVVKCDSNFVAIPEGQKTCEKLLAQIEKAAPDTVPPIVDCLNQAPCEQLSLQECGSKHMEELKGLMP